MVKRKTHSNKFKKMFIKERKEHPTFSIKQVEKIVKDHIGMR